MANKINCVEEISLTASYCPVGDGAILVDLPFGKICTFCELPLCKICTAEKLDECVECVQDVRYSPASNLCLRNCVLPEEPYVNDDKICKIPCFANCKFFKPKPSFSD